MWPFRRHRGHDDASAAAAPSSGPVHRAGPAAWRAAPPLAVVQTARTTLDTGFVGHLATRADPSFLAQLGHHVVPDAPSGAVHGLAAASPQPRTFTPPAGATGVTQRVVADAAPHHPPAPAVAVTPDAAGEPVTVAPLLAAQRSLVDASHVDLPPLPSVATVRLPPVPPTATDEDPAPSPADERSTATATPATESEPAVAPPVAPTIGAAPTAFEPTPPAAAPSAGPTTPVVSRLADAPAPGRPRPRIGAPIDRDATPPDTPTSPAPPTVSRAVAEPVRPAADPPAAAGLDAVPPEVGLVGATPLGHDVAVTEAGAAAGPASPSPVPTVQPTRHAATSPLASARQQDPAPAPTPTAATGAAATRPVAPIGAPIQRQTVSDVVAPTLGTDPFVTSMTGSSEPHSEDVSRDASAAAPQAVTASAPPAAPLVGPGRPTPTVLRELDAASPTPRTAPAITSTAATRPASAPPSGTEQRHQALGSATSGARATGPALAPVVQLAPLVGDRAVMSHTARRAEAPTVEQPAAGPSSGAGSPAPTRLPIDAPPAGQPGASSLPAVAAAPVVTRSAAMPVAVSRLVAAASSTAAPPTAPPSGESGPAPVVSVPPWVQRVEDTPAPEVPEPASDVAPSAAVTVDAPTTSPRAPSDEEVTELARALYPQLRRQLGRDLLLDRERLGYRTDIRY